MLFLVFCMWMLILEVMVKGVIMVVDMVTVLNDIEVIIIEVVGVEVVEIEVERVR